MSTKLAATVCSLAVLASLTATAGPAEATGGTRTATVHPAAAPQAVQPESAARRGTAVRFASFNVRTARATSDKRRWLRRAPEVARQIKAKNPGVVALQELGPGRADGRKGKTKGHERQTSSLLRNLKRVGAGKYRLVRTTPYVKPGTVHNTQGTRILYDSTRYRLAMRCPEKTGKRRYSTSCSLNLPLLHGDSRKRRRSAAYALLQNKRTGKRFWFASVHLDDRHSRRLSTERRYNALRGRQMAAVYRRIAKHNKAHHEVVIAGDVNSWLTNRGGNAPRTYLLHRGFRDTAFAHRRIRTSYTTINHFNRVLRPAHRGHGVRIDVILVRGAKVTRRFENVMKVVDSTRPSDHNMIVSDVVL